MNSFKCIYNNCGQTFATKPELLSHKSCHTSNNANNNNNNEHIYPIEYNCSECSYSVTNAALLKSHIEKHHKYDINTTQANSDANNTSITTATSNALSDSKQILRCDWPQCVAAYHNKVSLMNHMRIHRKDKLYVTIKTNSDISHKQTINTNKNSDKIFKCILDDCPYTALSSDELKTHIIGDHKEIELLDEDYIEDDGNRTQTNDCQLKPNSSISCFYPECEYVGKTNKGYKIHLFKKHGYRASIAANERQALFENIAINSNDNGNSKIDEQIDIKTEHSDNLMDTNENNEIKPIKTENLNDSNDKTKFVLINNSVPIDKIEDKTNIAVNTVPVKTKGFFHCYIEKCTYRGISRNGLRFHLLKSHNIKQNPNVLPNAFYTKSIDMKTNTELNKDMTKISSTIYNCPQTQCRFSTKSYDGLKVHMGKQHKRMPKLKMAIEAMGAKGYKCPECKFIGPNTNSLRMHMCNKHKIRIKCNNHLNNTEIKTEPTEIGETSENNVINSTVDPNSINIKKEDKLTTTIERVDSFEEVKPNNEEVKPNNQLKPKQSTNRFRCTIGGCAYIGKSFDARRMHIFKNHKEQRFTAYGYSSAIPNTNNYDVYTFNDNEAKLAAISNETNKKLFKCTYIGCNYMSASLKALRIHKRHKHRRILFGLTKKKPFHQMSSTADKVIATNITDNNNKDNSNSNAVNDDLVRRNVISVTNKEITVNQSPINNFNHNNITQMTDNSNMGSNQHANNSLRIGDQSSNQNIKNRGKRFKCQFPGCRFSGDDANALKTHVQNTHKSNQNSDGSVSMFKCYFPRCHFVGSDGVMLKQHIAVQHNYHIEAVKSTHKLFKCNYPNCQYSGSTTKKGLRIHYKRNHGRSVAKNVKYRQSINRRSLIKVREEARRRIQNNPNPNFGIMITPSSAASPYQLFLEERRRQQQISSANETSRKSMAIPSKNQMKFRCHYDECSFSVENLADLRSHQSEKHKNDF